MKKGIRLFLLAVCALLALSAVSTGLAEGKARKLTLMIYMCGSNLESQDGSATADLEEIIGSKCDFATTTVLVMAGGSDSWQMGFGPDELTLLVIDDHGLRYMPSLEGANMGEAGTLTALLDLGFQRFPAENYALILWNHGMGPLDGVCLDERYGEDRLYLDELARALADSPFAEQKLRWIGFDACLMGSLEVAQKLTPYAEYMIASQAQEPPNGWNYDFLDDLDPDADGATVGRRVVDRYFEAPRIYDMDLTLACIDLSAVEDVVASMDAMYSGLAGKLTADSFARIAKLRVKATSFGKAFASAQRATGYDLVDVVSLSACYAAEDPEAAEAVRAAMDRAVVYARSDAGNASGLSVYHPYRNSESFLGRWGEEYEKLGFCPGYTAYVESYGEIMSGTPLILWDDLENIRAEQVPDALGGSSASLVTLRLTDAQAANLADARLVVLGRNIYDAADDAFFRVYSTADVSARGSLLSAWYDGSSLQVVNAAGQGSLTGSISYRVGEDGEILVDLYPREDSHTRPEVPLVAEYEPGPNGTLALKSIRAYDEATGALTTRRRVDLDGYVGITFVNDYRLPTRNAADELLGFDEWEADVHDDTQWRARWDISRTDFMLSFALDPSLAEDLYAAFEITDTQGNTYMSNLTPLNASGLNYYPVEVSRGDMFPATAPYAQTLWDARVIAFGIEVLNTSDVAQDYLLDNLKVNGVALPDTFGFLLKGSGGSSDDEGGDGGLLPGDRGDVVVFLDAEDLAGFGPGDRLERIEGTLFVLGPEGAGQSYFQPFVAEPDIPLDAIFHEEGVPAPEVEASVEVPMVFTLVGDAPMSVYTQLIERPAEFAGDAEVIFNLAVRNESDSDISFLFSDLTVNGVPLDKEALNAEGGGGVSAGRRDTVAPGETRAATLVLEQSDIIPLIPDVALTRLEGAFMVSELVDGENTPALRLPLRFDMQVPLTAFYEEARMLPTPFLVEQGAAMGALDADSAKLLLDKLDTRMYLQGLFLEGRACVLLLRLENHGNTERYLNLGRATLDGEPARIGTSTDLFATVRNNQLRAYGLEEEPWRVPTGVHTELQPGETKLVYVTVEPGSEAQAEFYRLGFDALVRDRADMYAFAWQKGIGIYTEEPGPLTEGFEGVAPAEDFMVDLGETAPEASPDGLLEVPVDAADVEAARPVALTLALKDEEPLRTGYYVLFRRVRSEAELASLNILNDVSQETHAPKVAFADDREWLLYEAFGSLEPSADGASGSAVFPGLMASARSGGIRLPLSVTQIEPDAAGVTFSVTDHFMFTATDFAGLLMPGGTTSLALRLDGGTGAASKVDGRVIGVQTDWTPLVGEMFGAAKLIPADADDAALYEFLVAETGGVQLRRVMLLEDGDFHFAIEPIGDPSDYAVIFIYATGEEGGTQFKGPLPLTDFME